MRRPTKAGIGAWRNRFPPRGDVDLPDIRIAVDILFREAHAGGHVEHVLDAARRPSRWLPTRAGSRSPVVQVDDAAAGKHAERHAGHRLGHRLRQMQRALAHAVEISFVDDRAVLYDEEAVRVGLVEQTGQRRWLSLAVGDWQTRRDPARLAAVYACGRGRATLRPSAGSRGCAGMPNGSRAAGPSRCAAGSEWAATRP